MTLLPEVVDAGDGVLFRRPTLEDAPAIFVVHSDPRVYAFDPEKRHTDPAFTDTWIRRILDDWESDGIGYWTVLVPLSWWPETPAEVRCGDHAIAGEAGVKRFRFDDGGEDLLNVYFRFAVPVQGRGLAGRVVSTAATWAGATLPGTDLVIRTRPDNAPAKRVAIRAGFVEVGPSPLDDGLDVWRLRAGAGPDAVDVAG